MIQKTYSPLLTDFYQLTMAYGYWRLNLHEREAVFDLIFRKNPFDGNYVLCCGLQNFTDFLLNWQFQADDLAYLSSLKNRQGEILFPDAFLSYLESLRFTCDLYAIPEGTIVFPQLPLLRVQGPLLQCQLIETAALNIINFQSLIATKATRVCRAALGDQVIEFGMRRAQGPDGALSASRAAYIGGCHATSNTLAGKIYDIPVRGTHAHSWVTAFQNEMEAFKAYARVMPHNCVLLVDTFNSIQGVKNAIRVGKDLQATGGELLGVRLDSGDIAALSIESRALLDQAGLSKADIVASNTLNEYVIKEIKEQGGKINVWGVGTHLVTGFDQPALDGVYKLSALKNEAGEWQYKLKLSEQALKISNPGLHQVRRYFSNEEMMLDVIYDLRLGISEVPDPILLDKAMQPTRLDDYDGFVDLLQPILEKGKLIQPFQSIHFLREGAISGVNNFYRSHPEKIYPVAIEEKLHTLKQTLIKQLKI